MTFPDYDIEPVVIYQETVWIVNDPWTAQDIATFYNEEAAELFAKVWMERDLG